MPARNRIKQYSEESYYHLYNRGVEKRLIFQDKQDYITFLSYLKNYLLPKDRKKLLEIISSPISTPHEKDQALRLLRLNNFYNEITLMVYCLKPNHFHFLVKQKDAGSIDKFINSLGTRYTMYFNKKYKRVGSLYQGVYKAVMVTTNEQLLELSRYIHKQSDGQPSSYPEYLGERKTDWVHTEEILQFFSKNNPKLSYKSFVEQDEDLSSISKLLLEID